jgi:hypothetical protein
MTNSKMTQLSTGIASSPRLSPAQAQSRAISLNMAKSLAVVTLLSYSILLASRYQAFNNLLTGILSVVRGCGQPLDSWPVLHQNLV